jgi:hypothetical protein
MLALSSGYARKPRIIWNYLSGAVTPLISLSRRVFVYSEQVRTLWTRCKLVILNVFFGQLARRIFGNSVQASYFERFHWSILNFWTLYRPRGMLFRVPLPSCSTVCSAFWSILWIWWSVWKRMNPLQKVSNSF